MSLIIGHHSEFSERRARVVVAEGREIAVFKLTDGSYRAILNSCPHKQGKLSEGIVCGHHVHCPLHDWRISLDNGLVEEPDEGRVPAYLVVHNEETGMLSLVIHTEEAADEKAS